MKKRTNTLPEVNFSDQGSLRHLHLGTQWIQGSMDMDRPTALVHEYIERMMAWLLFVEPDSVPARQALQLGLGAGSLTKFCHKELRMKTTAIELNPQVLTACRGWFKLPAENARLQVVLAQRTPSRPKRELLTPRAEVIQTRWGLPATKWVRVFKPVSS